MAVMHARNQLREKSMRISRRFKGVFKGVPDRFAGLLRRWIWRWLFLSAEGKVHLGGHIVLHDLAKFCRMHQPTNFSTEPLIMARREGRREVYVRIINYLNLDEATVQKMMELDDGQ